VLIAEDDPDDRMLIREAFEERCPNCRLHFVQDGEELMAFIGETLSDPQNLSAPTLPDMVLLDLNMPLKDGRESLTELKNNALFEQVPTVVMTTSESDEDKQFCLANGANDYLVKPSSYTELLDAVESLQPYFSRNTGKH
jgi:CheY-like chemotaxis protein